MRAGVVVAAALIGVLAGCAASEPTAYGPTVAGPTKTSSKQDAPALPEPTIDEGEPPIVRVSGSRLCQLFTSAEISERLGLKVGKVVASTPGRYSRCVWKSAKGDGIVSITRGSGADYEALKQQYIAEATKEKARGRKELGVGQIGFAIGASVSGVPNWRAASVESGLLTGVQMSGAGSLASAATIKIFMIEVLARG
ncbi:hypothetical protein [Kribbella sp. NPDC051770]|uniref:hypothetical protein n=1 Tax=Kribbella sp. NPDC051770 TaxID=3155413 RepID=UPI003435D797